MTCRLSYIPLAYLKGVTSLLLVLVFCIAAPSSGAARAQESKVIRFHTTEWKDLTNRDGTGLYHEILSKVFKRKGFKVETTYFPFRRTILNVSLGEADIAGSTIPDEPHVLPAKHPIWESRISVLFHKKDSPDWEGLETLSSNKTVAPPGFGSIVDLKLHEVATRDQALNMLLDGRMQYYVDEHQTLSKLKSGKADILGFEGWRPPSGVDKIDWDMYEIRDVVYRPLHMIFENSERGRRLRDIFDQEMENLHKSGELARIYEKWGIPSKMAKCLPDQQ